MRLLWLSAIVLCSIGVSAGLRGQQGTPQVTQVTVDTLESFASFLERLIAEARERGYSDALIGQTLAGLEPLPRVIERDRTQAELNPGFTRYLSARVTKTMISRGRRHAQSHRTLLGRIEKAHDVQRRFLVAIWG